MGHSGPSRRYGREALHLCRAAGPRSVVRPSRVAGPGPPLFHRLKLARTHRPFTLVFAVILPFPGALAIIYGDEVSKALSGISVGVLSRVIGIALLLGGLATFTGLARGKSLYEAAGLTLMSGACVIYGIGVILGLGIGGMVAGPLALAIAISMILRVVSLTTLAREVSHTDE